jgi:outer membrane protein insertion porin family
MRRDAAQPLLALILSVSCSQRLPVSTPPAPGPDLDRARACAAPAGPAAGNAISPSTADPPEGARIATLAIEGARRVPGSLIEQVLQTRAGGSYESGIADADLERILQLGAFSDASFMTEPRDGGLRVIVQVTERPVIRRVYLALGSSQPKAEEWTPVLEGDPYDPLVVQRKARALQQTMLAEGYLDARAIEGAVRFAADQVDVCLHVDRGPEWTIESLLFPGAQVVSADKLAAEIDTHRDTANAPGKHYRSDLLEHDVLKMNVLHWEQGLVRAKIGSARVTRNTSTHRLQIELPVDEGAVYQVGSVRVSGAATGPRAAYEAIVAPLRGGRFARSRMVDTVDRLRQHHCKLSHNPRCDVAPSTELRDPESRIDVTFQLEGG